LAFGGYDQSRFVPNNITFPFDANDSRKPSLNIQAIVSQNLSNEPVNLLPDGAAYTLVDFAESHIWLPVSACDAFASAFNLTYDNNTDLYLVDPSTHAQLVERNLTITFGLGETSDPGKRVNVVLQYSAFDQKATYPIFENATNYFPIRRAYNDTQYTLGRTFFQEAYIRVDYERGNFSVHHALFPATNAKQQIIAIAALKVGSRVASGDGSRAFSRSTIAGVSVGSVAVLSFIVFFIRWMLRRRRNVTDIETEEPKEIQVEFVDHPKLETDGLPNLETDGIAFFEKDGQPFAKMEGHVFAELQSPQSELANADVQITRTDLSRMSELYELDDGARSSEDLPVIIVTKDPPPG